MVYVPAHVNKASMRPPEFTGGNQPPIVVRLDIEDSFNEAAGIHRRKLCLPPVLLIVHRLASMRPPEFTGGNAKRRV